MTSEDDNENANPQASNAETEKLGKAGQLIVVKGTTLINGGVISCTLMVWEAVEILPHRSVAVHVLVTLYVPAHDPGVLTSLNVREDTLPQRSDAVAVTNEGEAGQFMVLGDGSAEMTGGVISCTCIVCDAVEKLPHTSVAVQVLFTVYDAAHEPFVVTSANVSVNALPHASVAVATANTGVAGQLMVDGEGKAPMTGAVIS